MADVRATKSGNWSDTTVWNTGALPTSADDVWANTFTVAADTTTTVLSIRNGSTTNVTAGGGFTAVNGVTLTLTGSGVVAGSTTTTVFTSSLTTGQSCAIVGNLTAATGGCATNGSTGTLNITGNCTGGTSTGANAICVVNSSSGSISITGNVTGATQSGASNTSTGILNITGACTGGTGAVAGANNTSTGTLNHTGTVQASGTAAGIAGANAGQVTILTGPFLTSTNGVNPVTCVRWFWQNTTPPATYYQIRSANLSVIRPLYTADSVGGNPATSNVRSGTVYGPNSELTGTCAVPGASSVLSGVPVDATTGTATITAADIRAAVGLATANLDTQLAAKPSATAIRTEMDSNSTKLANLDATISSRSTYAGADTSGTTTLLSRLTSTRAGYLDNISAAPPTDAAIATAVNSALDRTGFSLTSAERTAIATAVEQSILNENDGQAILNAIVGAIGNTNVDQVALVAAIRADLERNGGTLATRLAASAYTAPPTAAANASAVRTELSTELGRIDATISSRTKPSDTQARVTLVDTTTTLSTAPTVPTPAQTASAVRTELAPELARLANAATTQEVADLVEGAL